jgi:hypothetical protein
MSRVVGAEKGETFYSNSTIYSMSRRAVFMPSIIKRRFTVEGVDGKNVKVARLADYA